MPAVPLTPITAQILAENWAGVELIYNTKDKMYETHVHEINWSGISTGADVQRCWVPPADAQILGIIATTLATTSGGVDIRIQGNVTIDRNVYYIPFSATPTRTNLLANTPRVKVGAGDAIIFNNIGSYDPVTPSQFRIHILYQIRWSAV